MTRARILGFVLLLGLAITARAAPADACEDEDYDDGESSEYAEYHVDDGGEDAAEAWMEAFEAQLEAIEDDLEARLEAIEDDLEARLEALEDGFDEPFGPEDPYGSAAGWFDLDLDLDIEID